MKVLYVVLFTVCYLSSTVYAQVDIPNVTGGPVAPGSWIRFLSAASVTSIQENWGINITGASIQPVKIFNASLLVGYTSNGQDFGSGNAYINGKLGIGTIAAQRQFQLGDANT